MSIETLTLVSGAPSDDELIVSEEQLNAVLGLPPGGIEEWVEPGDDVNYEENPELVALGPQWYDRLLDAGIGSTSWTGYEVARVIGNNQFSVNGEPIVVIENASHPDLTELDVLDREIFTHIRDFDKVAGYPRFEGFEDIGDDLIQVIQELDPNYELDPDHSLLDRCLIHAAILRNEYAGGGKPFPGTYLARLYRTELLYSEFIVSRALELVRKNKELGIEVKNFVMMWDLDRSQVLVADPPQRKEKGYIHMPRPGWGFTEARLRKALDAEGVALTNGVLTDQEFGKIDAAGLTIEQRAEAIFEGVGIELDRRFLISSTNGVIADRLPRHLKLRRAENRIDPATNKTIRASKEDVAALKAIQLAEIGNILDSEAAANNPDLDYHSKLGALSELADMLPPEEILGWSDDMFNTVPLANSVRIAGMPITPDLQPAAPDDDTMSEFYGF